MRGSVLSPPLVAWRVILGKSWTALGPGGWCVRWNPRTVLSVGACAVSPP